MLQYIGLDYGLAVDDGKILDPFEYNEMLELSRVVVGGVGELRRHGASSDVATDLRRLSDLIRHLRPWAEVRATCDDVVARLLDELDVTSLPRAAPDVERGGALYAESCASCHGPTGGGDGHAPRAPGPSPSSFRAGRMIELSPHHIYGAVTFGLAGTGMASFADTLPPQHRWDVAFYVMTLRDGFDPRPPGVALPLSLRDVATQSNQRLLALVQQRGAPEAILADIDSYRRYPPPAGSNVLTADASDSVGGAPVDGESTGPGVSDPGLEVAMQLQSAFARIAERVRPSVVGVTSFVRDDGRAPRKAEDEIGSWTDSDPEDLLYPGFRRHRSGSGFFATGDGYVLSYHGVVADGEGGLARVVDVEMPDGEHVLSRVVGVEPTINLAVLKLEVVPRQRPTTVPAATLGNSDEVQVGHWTIALGDPSGAEQTYAVGTLAARPDRVCYQEELSRTLLQASLSVHPESYGGPLVDIRGEVIGIVVPRPGGPSDVAWPYVAELALPINIAKGIFEALRVTESTVSPWLGFSVLELASVRRRRRGSGRSPELPRTGVYIDDLFDPSPASRAGVRVGDSLTKIDGNRLLSVLDFQKWLYLSGVGRTITLEIFRDGRLVEKRLTIEERPPAVAPR